jgi:hypothetical protein
LKAEAIYDTYPNPSKPLFKRVQCPSNRGFGGPGPAILAVYTILQYPKIFIGFYLHYPSAML